MEMTSSENSQASSFSSNAVDQHQENLDQQILNHGDAERKHEISVEEVRSILEVIAATGKFWHDWDVLKNLLSFQLKQVLAEYPEAEMSTDQQNSSLGETYIELVKRLDEALLSFVEGPPFTLQRLCEILLAARSIYPNLSKLALALEKNLLVTSTLSISTDPYPSTITQKSEEPEGGIEGSQPHSNQIQNGVQVMVGSEDEEMAEAEEADEDNKNTDVEPAEEMIQGTSENSSEPNTESEPTSESSMPPSGHLDSTSS
ncbi:PREDICTED: serine/threonine-protein phosphatase 4 regulatory subunit 2 isoform X2 [Nelumbo nucifera]|uniref:Serine/threonine-protein phosphatase 4 regulatory subunit 2 isoform X2 n=1 Tax=Nelumbo nucifera TaxID=4432 RepID=A0A1U7Z930_NELNU|nr:PREDICTED: serine/threonine-protein phosphatase 4 regulatory subunit 2 isoform X2 [Nelumbo nucifera]